MTDRHGGPSRWATVGLPLALAGLILVAVLALVAVPDQQRPVPPPAATSSAGSLVPMSDLAGKWSGDGAVTRCAGLDAEDCAGTRSVTLTIDCSRKPCVVTPFDRSYGSPPLDLEGGAYGAVGPLPTSAAPTCDGGLTSSGRWELEFRLEDGHLTGTYQESTIQGFDCGATSVGWAITLAHA